MKLLVIFDKETIISAEKVCVHTGHSNRAIMEQIMFDSKYGLPEDYKNWKDNHFKNVLLRDKLNDNLIQKIKEFEYWYEIYDAGLNGVYTPDTKLGYAVLVPNEDTTFKRLRTLKLD